LTALRVGTIHGICNLFVLEFRHKTSLGSGYEWLDDLTQLLFNFDHFNEILGEHAALPFLHRWTMKWGAIAALCDHLFGNPQGKSER
jgi:DNA helicase-2/ATP-dependent DNA helicase PcrA